MSEFTVKKIKINDFKAFRDFELNLDGRNMLAYGANGTGKSSLYWALYTFLQSGSKTSIEVAKYFDPDNDNKLLNEFALSDGSAEGKIEVELQNTDNSYNFYVISKDLHDTKLEPIITKANLASDFITYRVLFQFYHFRHSETVDLWPVFEQEILPFCNSSLLSNIGNKWLAIKRENPFTPGVRGIAARNSYNDYHTRVSNFNTALKEVIASISTKAQTFYLDNFHKQDDPDLNIKVGVIKDANYDEDPRKKQLNYPVISFGVKLAGEEIKKPHSFLNEAKLTQIALSIRFGATLTNLHDSPLKLLVIDDLLISLDMSNRMKVCWSSGNHNFACFK